MSKIRVEIKGCGKCDFCCRTTTIVHHYKCETYVSELVPSVESINEWAACEDCERLVEAGQWHDLAKFCCKFIPSGMPYITKLSLVLALHDEFKAHRI